MTCPVDSNNVSSKVGWHSPITSTQRPSGGKPGAAPSIAAVRRAIGALSHPDEILLTESRNRRRLPERWAKLGWAPDSNARKNLTLQKIHAAKIQLTLVLHQPGGSVRGERANFTSLVLLCIKAKFCNKICVGKLSQRSTQCTPLHSCRISIFRQILPYFF